MEQCLALTRTFTWNFGGVRWSSWLLEFIKMTTSCEFYTGLLIFTVILFVDFVRRPILSYISGPHHSFKPWAASHGLWQVAIHPVRVAHLNEVHKDDNDHEVHDGVQGRDQVYRAVEAVIEVVVALVLQTLLLFD